MKPPSVINEEQLNEKSIKDLYKMTPAQFKLWQKREGDKVEKFRKNSAKATAYFKKQMDKGAAARVDKMVGRVDKKGKALGANKKRSSGDGMAKN